MKVRYTPRARSDLDAIYAYLDRHSPIGARNVKSSIERRIDRLRDFPLIAPATEEPDVRELSLLRYPYRIYYRIDRDEVWILHVRHAARRPWLNER